MIKLNLNLKLFFLIKVCIISLIICLKSYADDPKIQKNMITIGSYDAMVKIKVFSSLTCPHCANFHIKVIPEIKKKYVESGKVQIILIDFPLDQAAFNASKLLHCLDQKKQITFLDTIYENQNEWAAGSSINEIKLQTINSEGRKSKKNTREKFSKNFDEKINKIKNKNIRNSLSQLLKTIKND